MKDTSTIKRVQGRLGVLDDGVPGQETFTALSITVGVEPGKYSRKDLILAIQTKAGLEPTGEDDAVFWNEILNYLDSREASNSDATGDFYVLEIPKGKTLPTEGAIPMLLSKLVGPLLTKLRSGAKSRGTFTTGLASILGGVALLAKGLTVEDVEVATTMIIGAINAIVPGIGLMMARDVNVSDEQAGAKKLTSVQ